MGEIGRTEIVEVAVALVTVVVLVPGCTTLAGGGDAPTTLDSMVVVLQLV